MYGFANSKHEETSHRKEVSPKQAFMACGGGAEREYQ